MVIVLKWNDRAVLYLPWSSSSSRPNHLTTPSSSRCSAHSLAEIKCEHTQCYRIESNGKGKVIAYRTYAIFHLAKHAKGVYIFAIMGWWAAGIWCLARRSLCIWIQLQIQYGTVKFGFEDALRKIIVSIRIDWFILWKDSAISEIIFTKFRCD